jgi:hypothetical protein
VNRLAHTISFRNADRHRDQYRAQLWINGERLGMVEKGFVQGGIGGTDYLADGQARDTGALD